MVWPSTTSSSGSSWPASTRGCAGWACSSPATRPRPRSWPGRRWADLVALGGAPPERPGRLRPQGAGQPAPLAAAPGRGRVPVPGRHEDEAGPTPRGRAGHGPLAGRPGPPAPPAGRAALRRPDGLAWPTEHGAFDQFLRRRGRRGRALAVRGVLAVVVALALAAGIPACSPAGRPAVRLGDLAGLERGRHLCHRLALPLHPGAGLPEGRPLAGPDRPGRDRRGPRRPPAGPGGGPAARRRPAHHQCPARRGAWRAYVRQASEDVFELEFPGYRPRPGTGVHAEDIEPTYLLKGQLGVLRDCLS